MRDYRRPQSCWQCFAARGLEAIAVKWWHCVFEGKCNNTMLAVRCLERYKANLR